MLLVLLSLKIDLKDWHLMVYDWNKFPEMVPWRETSGVTEAPSFPF